MKKTVIINISGIIFHIDEDAFEKLNRYLDRVKAHFAQSESREEIIGDIEGRVAELLQEKLTATKQVITNEDIDEVITLMGEPNMFDEDDPDEVKSERFARSGNRPKRLYRDPDTRMVAGVSSGLAYYFNIDPIWFRVLFIVTSFSGAGLLAYLILWLVVPEASTTAEKLEMRGEPVNLSNIEASISEEFDHLKKKVGDLADEAKKSFKKKSKPTILVDFLQAKGTIFRIFFKVIFIIIGIFLTLFGLTIVLSLLAGIAGLSSFSFIDHGELIGFSLPVFLDMIFSTQTLGIFAVVAIALIIFVPLLMLIYLGLRLLFGSRIKVNYIGWTALGLWLTGLILGAFVVLNTSLDFRHSVIHLDEYEIPLIPTDTLYLNAVDDKDLTNYQRFEAFDMHVHLSGNNHVLYAAPNIYFKKALGNTARISVEAFSKGRTSEEAYDRAVEINYEPLITDSSFILPTYFTLPPNSLIREQYVDMSIEIPVGQAVYFSDNMRKLFNEDWRYHRYREYSGRFWVMTEDGLKPFTETRKEEEKEEGEVLPAEVIN